MLISSKNTLRETSIACRVAERLSRKDIRMHFMMRKLWPKMGNHLPKVTPAANVMSLSGNDRWFSLQLFC